MLVNCVIYTFPADKAEEAAKVLAPLRDGSRAEAGCITFDVSRSTEDPNVFVGPWTETRNYALRPELEKIDEFVCENNRDYKPLFKK